MVKKNRFFFSLISIINLIFLLGTFSNLGWAQSLPSEANPQILQKEKKASDKITTKVKTPPQNINKVRPFGYNFFSKEILETIENIPVTPNYIIGPGDVILITIWGRVNAQYTLKVSREGKIYIPNIGTFTVAGLTYQEMKKFIEKQISRITGAKGEVTLKKLRSIVIFVTGEVINPGPYVLTPMHTIIDALIAAGGPSKTGSLRNIILRRNNKIIEKIDFYNFILKGIKPKHYYLMHGDVIFVPTGGPRIKITGMIKRPAIYELKKEEFLAQVIALAGGLLPEAYKKRIQVERVEKHIRRIVLDVNAENKEILNTFKIQDGDWIKVLPVFKGLENVVYLKGNVKRPGKYAYKKGMRIKDILTSPKDLLPDTFMDYAVIKRFHSENNTYEYKIFSLKGLFIENNPEDNLGLQPKDTIIVYNKWEIMKKKKVYIYGAVNKPGEYEWLPGMKIADLVKLAGGLKKYAYHEAELIQKIPSQNGTITKIQKIDIFKALEDDPKFNFTLEENDSLIIRNVPGWYEDIKVKIYGEVKFPGTYVVSKGEKLSSLIKRAGGFTDKAYLRGAKFIRKSVFEKQQKFIEDLISRLQQELLIFQTQTITSISPEELKRTKAEFKAKRRFIEKLKGLKATGRMVIHLTPPDVLAKTPYDVTLEDGDEIYIPQKPSTVLVQGAVFSPGAFVYDPNKKIGDYIKIAGGYLNIADKKNVYILKVDGSAVRVKDTFWSFQWNPDKKCWEKVSQLKLEPGDAIVVPYKLEKIAWLKNIKDITQILFQISVTTATLITIF